MKKNFSWPGTSLNHTLSSFVFIVITCITSPTFANITAEIEPNQINLGDSFQLMLTMDGISTHHTPDLLPLQHDFEINSTQHRVSTTILNGQMETLNQWGLVLTPKRAGKLNIPPIRIGNEESNALTIDVSSQGQVTSQPKSKRSSTPLSANKRLQVQTKVSVKEPYVNQEILVTVKLIHQDQLLDANYQPPTLKDGLVVPLGDSEQYQLVENNQIFTVEEQRYAFFPQKPGAQVITGAHFQALVYRGLPQRVQAKGKPVLLNVKQIPQNMQAKPWLPAKAMLLTEEYSKPGNTFEVGTTLTRTIKIEARALPSELIPTLKAEPNDHFGVYPEKPNTKNSIHRQDIAGIKTLRITYLLNQPGTITLPGYSLTWFNTTTGKEEVSQIPERVLQITGTRTMESPQATPTSTQATPQKPATAAANNQTAWFIAAVFGVAWIITLLAFLYYKKHPRIKKQKENTLEKLHRACQDNDLIAIRAALLAWAQSTWPQAVILNLDDIKKQLQDHVFKEAISGLSEALYRKNRTVEWHAQTLWDCVKNYRKKPRKYAKKIGLPKLNP